MVTLTQLLNTSGQLHYTGKHECTQSVGARGKVTDNITSVRRSGLIQTWKRDPLRFHLPVKYGMYESFWIDQSNTQHFHLASECPLLSVNV